ncbi:MAG: hypothetical protein M3331_03960 [Actinomycetota bacterium]|nr:hypothetical protein [Actinomycetota bacterium]
MPNYVTNKLALAGERKALEEFIEENRSDQPDGWPLDFGQAVPMPSEVRDAEAKPNEFPDWYGWRLENWGTKWNADSVTLEGDPANGSVIYTPHRLEPTGSLARRSLERVRQPRVSPRVRRGDAPLRGKGGLARRRAQAIRVGRTGESRLG